MARLGELADQQAAFEERGVALYVVTVYGAGEVERWVRQRGYPQRFLVDGGAMAEAFGVARDNSRDGVPHPATVVIGADGTILMNAVHEQYREREAIPGVLEVLDGARAAEPEAHAAPEPAPAGPPELSIDWPADGTVEAGRPAEATLTLRIPDGAHVYGAGEEVATPVEWTLGPVEGLSVLGIEAPPAVRKELPIGVSHVHEGTVALVARLELDPEAAAPVTVPLQVRYQVCTHRTCFAPEEATGELVLTPTPPG